MAGEVEGAEGVLARFVAGDEGISLCEETARLAVVDLDWDRIRAVDIFAARHQCPPLGFLRIALLCIHMANSGRTSGWGADPAIIHAQEWSHPARDGVPIRLWAAAPSAGGAND